MVQLFALRERGWLQPDVEDFIWKQLRHAYGAQATLFATRDALIEALGATPLPRVFLLPAATERGEVLEFYRHPASAVYIFGNAFDGLRDVRRATDAALTVYTPKQVDMFAVNVAAILLQDRERKGVN